MQHFDSTVRRWEWIWRTFFQGQNVGNVFKSAFFLLKKTAWLLILKRFCLRGIAILRPFFSILLTNLTMLHWVQIFLSTINQKTVNIGSNTIIKIFIKGTSTQLYENVCLIFFWTIDISRSPHWRRTDIWFL